MKDATTFSPHTVYRAYSEHGVLLYVGCTAHLASRLSQHKSTSRWFPLAARFEVEEYPNYFQGCGAEARAIRDEDPICNVAGRKIPRPLAALERTAFLDALLGVDEAVA